MLSRSRRGSSKAAVDWDTGGAAVAVVGDPTATGASPPGSGSKPAVSRFKGAAKRLMSSFKREFSRCAMRALWVVQ